jgi:hypothetical protein
MVVSHDGEVKLIADSFVIKFWNRGVALETF